MQILQRLSRAADTELYWPTRSAHTRAGHVDYMDDLRTLTPYLKKQAQRFSGIDAVLDKAVEDYGLGQYFMLSTVAPEGVPYTLGTAELLSVWCSMWSGGHCG